jgi:CheY-like chemotaxis protein
MENQKSIVYVLDDDDSNLALLEKVLSKSYEVKVFKDPFECLKVCIATDPTLVIADLNMPNIDGFEFLEMLKSNPKTLHIPILCTSASGQYEQRESLIEQGAIGLLRKPYDIKTLNNNIKNILENLNPSVTSIDHKYTSTIFYSEKEKYKSINKVLREKLEAGQRVLLITWSRGLSLIGHEFENFINVEQLVLLEIKSNLVVKLPYLHDPSPILQDMFDLLNKTDLKDYFFVFDDYRNLFDPDESERAYSATLSLSRMFQSTFESGYFPMTKFNEAEHRFFLLKISRTLTGTLA